MYKHILITTDGSELAAKGVEHGLSLAHSLGAAVTVLSVVEPLRPELMEAALSGGMADPLMGYEQRTDEELSGLWAEIKARAAELKVEVTTLRENSESPAGAIVQTAAARGCDLIVMASRGRTGIKRMLLGSQTATVLKNTSVPVLVVQ